MRGASLVVRLLLLAMCRPHQPVPTRGWAQPPRGRRCGRQQKAASSVRFAGHCTVHRFTPTRVPREQLFHSRRDRKLARAAAHGRPALQPGQEWIAAQLQHSSSYASSYLREQLRELIQGERAKAMARKRAEATTESPAPNHQIAHTVKAASDSRAREAETVPRGRDAIASPTTVLLFLEDVL